MKENSITVRRGKMCTPLQDGQSHTQPYKNGGNNMDDIRVYGKENCKICERAQEKLTAMGLAYEYHDIVQHTASDVIDWRHKDSVNVLAALSFYNKHYPIIKINGQYLNYSGAMKVAKGMQKEAN